MQVDDPYSEIKDQLMGLDIEDNLYQQELEYIQRTLKEISKRDGSEFIPLFECCIKWEKINLRKSYKKRNEHINKIKDLKNVVFIPTMPSRTNYVEYNFKNLREWEYWCFEVDPKKFDSIYLANWFNTRLPKEQLIKLAPSGNYLKKISSKDLPNIYVIKHSLEQQQIHNDTLGIIIKLKNKITNIENNNSFDPKDITVDTLVSDIDELKTLNLINKDESTNYECKSTLRLDLKTKNHEKHITFAALKTIAAFLNTEGGDLVIGVKEDTKSGNKEVIGLEKETSNIDEWCRFLVDNIRDKIGKKFMETYVKIETRKYKNLTIGIVNCKELPKDLHATLEENNRKEIFVRTHSLTKKLDPGDVVEWIGTRT